jgi:hypothetical protein
MIIERLEVRPDQAIGVRAGAVSPPGDPSASGVKRGNPAAHAEFASTVADDYFISGDHRGHRHRLALVNLTEFYLPNFLP